MDKPTARQQAIDHLTKVVADCTEAIGASDVWADYSPHDRTRSLALFHETRDVAKRLLANLAAGEPVGRGDWQRAMPRDDQWTAVYKALRAQHHD
jgi:hypothetical protein